MFSIIISLVGLAFVGLGMAIVRSETDEYKVAAAGSVPSGTIISYAGKFWISQNVKTLEAGEMVTYRKDLVVEVTKNDPADVWADGANVEVNLATGLAETGQTVIGKARGGTGNGDLTVKIALNE